MWIALYLPASSSTPLSLMERKNYSISLCVHQRTFVCHQRSVGCSCFLNNWRDKIEKIVGCKTIGYLVYDEFMFISSVLE